MVGVLGQGPALGILMEFGMKNNDRTKSGGENEHPTNGSAGRSGLQKLMSLIHVSHIGIHTMDRGEVVPVYDRRVRRREGAD
jgi:hypothetical protein